MTLELIPVIELEPSTYNRIERELPLANPDEDPSSWYAYWKSCLSDSGMNELEPYGNTWFVPVTQAHTWKTSSIRSLLEDALEDTLPVFDIEFVGSLSGGYILRTSDGREILPQCCGDLANITEWEAAAEWGSSQWKQVWIGHPWIYVRSLGAKLEFSFRESNYPPEVDTVTVVRQELRKALIKARTQVNKFGQKLEPVLSTLVPAGSVSEALRVLLYGHRH